MWVESMSDQPKKTKPLLRGYIHQEAFFVALGACALLVAKSSTSVALAASLIYSMGLLFMFGVSAIYHRPHWQPTSRAFLKRIDHSAIFVLIASTATPLCFLALTEETGRQFLLIIWSVAVVGILQSIFWVKAPKSMTALFYIGMGWLAVPYLSEFKEALGATRLVLFVIGGVASTLGAIFYAIKRPRLIPAVFGYHEVFHVFTIIGAILHFIAIYQLIE